MPMNLIGVYERTLSCGEVVLVKPGVQAALIHCTSWIDQDDCAIYCDWHSENSTALGWMPFHDYPMAPENIFKTLDASDGWLRKALFELAEELGAESVYWRTEPAAHIEGFLCSPTYKAIAICSFLKGERW